MQKRMNLSQNAEAQPTSQSLEELTKRGFSCASTRGALRGLHWKPTGPCDVQRANKTETAASRDFPSPSFKKCQRKKSKGARAFLTLYYYYIMLVLLHNTSCILFSIWTPTYATWSRVPALQGVRTQ